MFLFAEGGHHTPLIVEFINHYLGEPVLRFQLAYTYPAWQWLFDKLGVKNTPEAVFGEYTAENAIPWYTIMFVIACILTMVAIWIFKGKLSGDDPKPGQLTLEAGFLALKDLITSVVGEHGYRYFPVVATFAVLVLISNLMGIFPLFMSPTASVNVTLALAKRLIQLGIDAEKVKVTGNIKFDQKFDEGENNLTRGLRDRFRISKDAPLIIAASTHAPEEKWILQAFSDVRQNTKGKLPRLLIAPRHPERFEEVAKLIKEMGLELARRSQKISEQDYSAEVILLDSIGELRAAYHLAEIVFVGGSLIPHGGQSILEPAIAQKAIVTGFYTMNFDAATNEFLEHNALVQLPQLNENEISSKLAGTFLNLLQDAKRREELARNASSVMEKNRGATTKTIELLKPLLQISDK